MMSLLLPNRLSRSDSTAMRLLQTHVVLCVLVWTAQASDYKSYVAQARVMKRHMEWQSKSFAATSGNAALLQGDQATNSSRYPVRRVLKGRRPLPHAQTSNTQQVEKPNVPLTVTVAPRQGSPSSHVRTSNRTGSVNILAKFAGKNRVLVISAPHESDGYYRLMMSLLKPDVYCQMADRHMQQINMFHGKEEMGGKIRRVNNDGSIVEEQLDPALVPRLMSFLKLEEGKFGMVLLRKTLQVEERYPYPVQLEAMYEIIDQTPMRRLEKVRQKGFVERCKATGMQGKVMQSIGTALLDPKSDVQKGSQNIERVEGARPHPKPTQSTTRQSTTTPTTKVTRRRIPIHRANIKPTITTVAATTISTTTTTTTTTATTTTTTTTPTTTTTTTTASTTLPTTLPTSTPSPTTLSTTVAQRHPHTPSHKHKPQISTFEPNRQREKGTTDLAVSSDKKVQQREKHKDQTDKVSPGSRKQKPIKNKPPRGKTAAKEPINEHVEKPEEGTPTSSEPVENLLTTKTVKASREKAEKNKKTERTEKPVKKNNTEKKVPKPSKDAKVNVQGRNVPQKAGSLEGKGSEKPVDNKKALETFLSYFEKRRRLLVITTPSEDNKMYSQQKDEYLEQVCDMALRKISIITIFGPLANATMKIDHYQMEQDKPVRSLPVSELINQELITAFRKELGMVYNDFFMALTDFDMKVKQQYEVPIIMKAVFDYIDTFSSRLKEMELQRKLGIACKKEDKSRTLENFLSRFRWRRRLLVISTPTDEEWAYQQQLHALTSQACNLGLRHMSVLKLTGRVMEDMGGVLELYPINGSSIVEREDLSASLVHNIRNYFQVSADYFSMLLVGKDGNVKSWYPSPMWSMSIIYELIDSMQLRRQEMAIQMSLGMHCPEEEYGHHEDYHEGYHRGYSY